MASHVAMWHVGAQKIEGRETGDFGLDFAGGDVQKVMSFHTLATTCSYVVLHVATRSYVESTTTCTNY